MRLLLALLLAAVLSACGRGETTAAETPQLDSFRGRWVVINYWAEWCKPCIKEIPELNALAETYPQVAVVGVNFDGTSGEALAQQVQALGVAFPILENDPAARLGTPRPVVLPTTLILDPAGKLVQTLVGPQTLESLALATGQAAMPETRPASEAPADEQR